MSDMKETDIEEIDPDIQLISDYLARALTNAEAEAVEDRMVEDDAFFEKISPILKVWSMPVSFRDRLAGRETVAPGRADAALRVAGATSERAARPRSMPLSLRELEELYPRTPREPPVLAQATALVGVSESRRRLPSLSKRARVMLAVAAVLLALVIPPAVRFISFLRHSDAIASGSGKLSSAKLESGAAAVTSVGETRVFALDDFSSILLRPGSRFFYKQAPGRPEVLASLEGEAEIIVSPTTHLMRLQTSVGSMVLMPGDYAVRCGAECEELLITVGRGTAILRASGSTPVVQIHAGEYGRFPRGGQPESTAGGDGYPILTSPPGDAP